MTIGPNQLRKLGHALVEIARTRLHQHLDDNDRREVPRIPFRQVMRCIAVTAQNAAQSESRRRDWMDVLSLDVSSAGLSILGSTPITVGSIIVVDCVPDTSHKIHIPGQIIWIEEPIPNFHEMGIQFQYRSDILEQLGL